MLRFTF